MGTLWDRSKGPGPNPEVKLTEIPLDGSQMHVTQFDRNLNQRVSWETNGVSDTLQNVHSTNQNVPKGRPGRH